MKKYDAIIIGGGHNTLVAACYLNTLQEVLLKLRKSIQKYIQSIPVLAIFDTSFSNQLIEFIFIRIETIQKTYLEYHSRKNKWEYLLINSDSTFCKLKIAKFSKGESEVYDEQNHFLSEIIDLWNYYQDKYPYYSSAKGRGCQFKEKS